MIPKLDVKRISAIGIGSSTGGPNIVEQIITGLPADIPAPILIAQHLPPTFTPNFARSLAHAAALNVVHAEDGMPALPGTVYIGEGHKHMRLVRPKFGRLQIEISPLPTDLLFRPSVDELLGSMAAAVNGCALGVVLSGLGKDGVVGASKLVDAGGTILTQSQSTCVVYGMPRACDESGLSAASLDPDDIRRCLLQLSPRFADTADLA